MSTSHSGVSSAQPGVVLFGWVVGQPDVSLGKSGVSSAYIALVTLPGVAAQSSRPAVRWRWRHAGGDGGGRGILSGMTNLAEPESDADLEVRAIAAERLTFFADAVIAIALTLLALDLPLPQGTTNGAMFHALIVNQDAYIAFVVSFIVIAAHWRSHHRIFRYVTHLDGRLTGLTMAWLFMQVIMPFATRVLTGEGAFQTRFGFYAVVQIASFALFALIVTEIRRKHLYRANMPLAMFSHTYIRLAGIAAGFGLSIPVSLFTHYAYICWIAGPTLTNITARLLGNRPPTTPA